MVFPERAAAPPVDLALGGVPNGLGGSMSVELIGIVTVGVALAGVILTSFMSGYA